MILNVEPHAEADGFYAVIPHGETEPVKTYGSKVAAWHHACWQPFHETNTLPKITPGNWFDVAKGKGYTTDPRYAKTVPADTVDPETRERIERAITKFIRATTGDMDPVEMFWPEGDHPRTLPEFNEPIPERAESRPCGRGICAANEGHEGTCDEASGWADEPEILEPSPEERAQASTATERLAEYAARDEKQNAELAESLSPWERAAKRVSAPVEDSAGPEPQPEPESPAEPVSAIPEGLSERAAHAWQNYTDLAENADNPTVRLYWQGKAAALIGGSVTA